jgi:hypothetical protein
MSELERAMDALYDRMVEECADPRAEQYQAEFKAAEVEARERFARWEREALDDRRRYHELCGSNKKAADERARHEVMLLSIDVTEERDRLIAYHWRIFTGRLARLMEEAKDGVEANPSGVPPA